MLVADCNARVINVSSAISKVKGRIWKQQGERYDSIWVNHKTLSEKWHAFIQGNLSMDWKTPDSTIIENDIGL